MALQLDNHHMASPRELTDVNKENFQSKLVDSFEPIVLRSFAKHWPLVQHSSSEPRQALDYLKQHAVEGSMSLTRIDKRHAGRLFYDENMQAMNFGVAAKPVEECINRMANAADADYCVQCVPIHKHFPKLTDKIPNPLLDEQIKPFIWMGNQITVAPHFDEAHNIAVVAAGRRRFTLFPPEQTKNLYIGPLDHTPAGQPISLVDILDPQLDTHPKYQQAYSHGLSVELGPGDAIFIPSPWWHHVQSLDSFNVLINYWWTGCKVSSGLPFPLLVHAIQALKPMKPEQRAAWKHILQHFVFDDDNDPAAHLPPHAKGMLGDMSPQLADHIHRWLKTQL